MATVVTKDGAEMLKPRAYQLEMLEDSMQRNIIVAMDTGSGKTNIAILRMAAELERCPVDKRVWFLCPKVALAQQQHRVISSQLPSFPAKLLVGRDGCEFWGTQAIWDEVLLNTRTIVCTHQILYDALLHGFVRLSNIALLVFDEAHYCKDQHAANKIMQGFYHRAKSKGESITPHILGLTASPIFGSEVGGLEIIERNLDAICRTPRIHREELLRYVHQPALIQQSYEQSRLPEVRLFRDLINIYQNLDINEDPWVQHLRACENTKPQQLERAILKGKTTCQDQLKSFVETANTIHKELGPWACEAYILSSINGFRAKKQDFIRFSDSINEKEAAYLLNVFDRLDTRPDFVGKEFEVTFLTAKVHTLLQILDAEIRPDFSGIVFVTTRAAVCLLKKLFDIHHTTRTKFRVGASVGTSSNVQRKSTISDAVSKDKSNEDLEDVLEDLRIGRKNLLISTDVVEEGIDIAACNTVVCFDEPSNLKSFVQRRGRARDSKSKYFIMFPKHVVQSGADQWHQLEEEMRQKYMDEMRELQRIELSEKVDDGNIAFEVASTGARLTIRDAIGHLHHFCNSLPQVQYASLAPLFIHNGHPSQDNVSCRVILPNCVEQSVREFKSSRLWGSERMAQMDAAFEAYVGLYHAGLINDHLLPVGMLSEEESEMYRKIEKRPNVVFVEKQSDSLLHIAQAWSNQALLRRFNVTIRKHEEIQIEMQLLVPLLPERIQDLTLHIDADTQLTVSFEYQGVSSCALEENVRAEEFTRAILYSVFRTRMDLSKTGLLALFCPSLDLSSDYLTSIQQSYPFAPHLFVPEYTDVAGMGLIRDQNATPHIFDCMEMNTIPASSPESSPEPKSLILASRLPKRTDFLHPISAKSARKTRASVLLDPERCTVDSLPLPYSVFATFIPGITYHLCNTLTVAQFQRTLFSNAVFAKCSSINTTMIETALSAPIARLGRDYQRQEFLGDAVFKFFAAVTIMGAHPNWPEGYLAYSKDLVVSNKSAALAAKETGLEKYILRTPFTGHKWRPSYISDVLTRAEHHNNAQGEELSTKILADVVEALIGAAYLSSDSSSTFASSESAVLAMLAFFTPSTLRTKIDYQPLATQHEALLAAVPSLNLTHKPPPVTHLERLIGYTFTYPALALEALTHPNQISVSSTGTRGVGNYQRLEFLGDAVLDLIVTRHISAQNVSIPVGTMHLLRAAAVNADVLAFFALRLGIDVEVTELATPSPRSSPSPEPKQARISKTRNSRPKAWPSNLPSPRRTTRLLNLPQLLRHAPSRGLTENLAATQARFSSLGDEIGTALDEPANGYPWTALATLAPEKLVSDLVEAVLGAIYVDSAGDLNACRGWVQRLGVWTWLERAVAVAIGTRASSPKDRESELNIKGTDGRARKDEKNASGKLGRDAYLLHPKQALGVAAGMEKVRYEVRIEGSGDPGSENSNRAGARGDPTTNGAASTPKTLPLDPETLNLSPSPTSDTVTDISPDAGTNTDTTSAEIDGDVGRVHCSIFVGEREICSAQGNSRHIAETRAAEIAVGILRGGAEEKTRENGVVELQGGGRPESEEERSEKSELSDD